MNEFAPDRPKRPTLPALPTTLGAILLASFGLATLPTAAAREDQKSAATNESKLHDPLAEAAQNADDVSKSLVAAGTSYDVTALSAAVGKLEQRHGTSESKADDDYFLAQGKLGLLAIKRFYETDLPDSMPAVLTSIELDPFADGALAIAQRYADAHPDHSDIRRVIGELYSAKIRGMTGGMTYGPKARDAIDAALVKDPNNALAILGQGRMHYHNPSFAGGDKDLALVEFRHVADDTGHIRANLYLARIYRDREMYTQARFFAKKALRAAPANPEAKLLHDDAAAKENAAKQVGGDR